MKGPAFNIGGFYHPLHTPHIPEEMKLPMNLPTGGWKGENLGLCFPIFSRAIEYTCLQAWPGSAWLLQSASEMSHIPNRSWGYEDDTLGRYYGQVDRVSRESHVEGATSSECPVGSEILGEQVEEQWALESAEGYKDLSRLSIKSLSLSFWESC